MSYQSLKLRVALHSLGGAALMLILLTFGVIQKLPNIFILGISPVFVAEILRIIFSKRKYLLTIHQTAEEVTFTYLDGKLFTKKVVLCNNNLSVIDVTETNLWSGDLDLLSFSNTKENLKFSLIDRKLKESLLKLLITQ